MNPLSQDQHNSLPATPPNRVQTDPFDLSDLDQYKITSNDCTPGSSSNADTTNLLETIQTLEDELILERDATAHVMDNLETTTIRYDANIAHLTDQLRDLQTKLDAQVHRPRTPPPTQTPAPPPATDPALLLLIQQQQQMFQQHMTQNAQILKDLGKGIATLQTAAVQTANATAAQTQVAIDARDKRGPHNNKLPKFRPKTRKYSLAGMTMFSVF